MFPVITKISCKIRQLLEDICAGMLGWKAIYTRDRKNNECPEMGSEASFQQSAASNQLSAVSYQFLRGCLSLGVLNFVLVLTLSLGISNAALAQVSAGESTTCVIKSDGGLYCWGCGDFGVLGDGTTSHKYTPPVSPVLTDVKDVSSSGAYTCAVKNDGGLYCWGLNNKGQLGDGTTSNRATPPVSPVLTDVKEVSVGGKSTCAVKNDGGLYCWGYNGNGQLGDGTTSDRATPPVSPVLTDVKEISLGDGHICAVKSDGGLYCWGYNGYGQLGDGTSTSIHAPPISPVLTDVKEVSASFRHTCAVKNDGGLYCWGSNYYGQLGDGTNDNTSSPPVSSVLTNVKGVSASARNTCAVKNDGGLYCWGWNIFGQLGDGTNNDTISPPVSPVLIDVKEISLGYGHTCAVKSDGQLYCWGHNNYGQLGDGTTSNNPNTQSILNLGCAVTNLGLTITGGCGILSDGRMSCFGFSNAGQLGFGDNTIRDLPYFIYHDNGKVAGNDVLSMSGCGSTSCAIVDDGVGNADEGKVYCTGSNSNGALGANQSSGIGVSEYVAVYNSSTGTSDGYIDGKAVKKVSTNYNHSLAITSDGALYGWGYGASGLIGDGGTTNRIAPVAVTSLSNGVTAVSAGMYVSCAVKNSELYCWGSNDDSNILLTTFGLNNIQPSPVKLTHTDPSFSNSNIIDVSVGRYFACFIKIENGESVLYCWGDNTYGQLGNGTTNATSSSVPPSKVIDVDDNPLTHVSAVSVSNNNHACALANGLMYCWGGNTYGEVGNGRNSTSVLKATKIKNFSGADGKIGLNTVNAMETAGQGTMSAPHTCAIAGGRLYCWGLSRALMVPSTYYRPLGAYDDLESHLDWESQITSQDYINFPSRQTVLDSSCEDIICQDGTHSDNDLGYQCGRYPVDYFEEYEDDSLVGYYYCDSSDTVQCSAPCLGDANYSSLEIGGSCHASNVCMVYQCEDDEISCSRNEALIETPSCIAGKDQDCDGILDLEQAICTGCSDPDGLIGTDCATGDSGVCGDGIYQCEDSNIVCVRRHNEGTEICGDFIDNDCDGDVDEDCTITPDDSCDVTSFSVGERFACAVKYGRVYCWGLNTYGQLGNNAIGATYNTPVRVYNSGTLGDGYIEDKRVISVSVAASASSACAITEDHRLYCWGVNGNGQLGINSTTDSSIPVAVYDPQTGTQTGYIRGEGISQVSTGGTSTCAITMRGYLYCWGNNSLGQLGSNDAVNSLIPRPIYNGVSGEAGKIGNDTVVKVAVSFGHACAITNSNKLYCFGYNGSGEVGIGSSGGAIRVPSAVSLLGNDVSDVAVAFGVSCAVSSGALYCFGSNGYGMHGNGVVGGATDVPELSGLTSGVTKVSIGNSGVCALENGLLKCWGLDTQGMLMQNSDLSSGDPTIIYPSLIYNGLDTAGEVHGYSVTDVDLGHSNSCVIANGHIYCSSKYDFTDGNPNNESDAYPTLPAVLDDEGCRCYNDPYEDEIGDECDVDGDLYGECDVGEYTCRYDTDDTVYCRQIHFDTDEEICDGKDNNCDGNTDESFPEEGDCDTGVPGVCADGVMVCNGVYPPVCQQVAVGFPRENELCDGLDDDCDGETDEDFKGIGVASLGNPCVAGNGVCAVSGNYECTEDQLGTKCSATADMSQQAPEICDDTIDNDCDGETDGTDPDCISNYECRNDAHYLDIGDECQNGQHGICGTGLYYCDTVHGTVECSTDYITGVDETCDGIDNDCDGLTDEDFPDKGSVCHNGTGECSRAGTMICKDDESGTICDAIPGEPTTEICNNRDDDCNEVVDDVEGLNEECSNNQVGVCADTGNMVCDCNSSDPDDCNSATLVCNAPIHTPGVEALETCSDGLDNDCDGKTDYLDTDSCVACAADPNLSLVGQDYNYTVNGVCFIAKWFCKESENVVNYTTYYPRGCPPEDDECINQGDLLDSDCDGVVDELDDCPQNPTKQKLSNEICGLCNYGTSLVNETPNTGGYLYTNSAACLADANSRGHCVELFREGTTYYIPDMDNDGIGNCSDRCPDDVTNSGALVSGNVGAGQCFKDTVTGYDMCPDDQFKTMSGYCGCGKTDVSYRDSAKLGRKCTTNELEGTYECGNNGKLSCKTTFGMGGFSGATRGIGGIDTNLIDTYAEFPKRALEPNFLDPSNDTDDSNGIVSPCFLNPKYSKLGADCHKGRGNCYSPGIYMCDSSEAKVYCSLISNVDPVDEICDNGLDDDCDGKVDEGCGPCDNLVTTAKVGSWCHNGQLGVCARAGSNVCVVEGSTPKIACSAGYIEAGAEVCGNEFDDDCDGVIDNNCTPCADDELFESIGKGCKNGKYGVCAAEGTYKCNEETDKVYCDAPVNEGCEPCKNDKDFSIIGKKCDNGKCGECRRDGYFYCDFEEDEVKCSADEASNCVEPTPTVTPTVVPTETATPTATPTETVTPTPTGLLPAPKVLKKVKRKNGTILKLESLANYKLEEKDKVRYQVVLKKVGTKKAVRKFVINRDRLNFGKLKQGRYFIQYRVVRIENRSKKAVTKWSKKNYFKIKK